jgi:alpha-L-fucosidase
VERGVNVSLQVILITLTIGLALGASVSAASAWWQFAANSPNGERQTSPHYDTLKECERALKVAESKLAKKYPDLYPLVGSCEEYR